MICIIWVMKQVCQKQKYRIHPPKKNKYVYNICIYKNINTQYIYIYIYPYIYICILYFFSFGQGTPLHSAQQAHAVGVWRSLQPRDELKGIVSWFCKHRSKTQWSSVIFCGKNLGKKVFVEKLVKSHQLRSENMLHTTRCLGHTHRRHDLALRSCGFFEKLPKFMTSSLPTKICSSIILKKRIDIIFPKKHSNPPKFFIWGGS